MPPADTVVQETASARRQNWIAIAISTVPMMASSFIYAAAFVTTDDGNDVEPFLVAVALAIAPFVFVALAFLSRNPQAPRHVLQAMALLLAVGLTIGLLDPLAGAATGFAAGGAVTLHRPTVPRLMRWRAGAVVFTAVYCLALLIAITPAGVLTGAIVPLILVGFADEYAVWSAS